MDTKKIKILYAEDNRITAQETGEALEDNGYEVKTVFDGDEAWLAYQSSRPDVVVLDYQMPGKTGIEVFLLIRQLDKKIPVLILSSYTELCAASLKIGTSDFVRKDGGIDELCARIEAALNRYPGPEITGHPSEKVYQLSPPSRFYPANSPLEIGDQRYPLKTMLAELLTIFCQNQNSFIPGMSVLCSHNFSVPFNQPIAYAQKVGELTNMLGNGHILVQRFGDILDGKRTWQKELAQSNVRPTLPDVVAGDITAAMPYRAMTNIINFIQAADIVVPGFASAETLLYSPELKFYSNRVKMDENLNTNVQGLHCLGDSSGWTRGLMMASAMGVLMGRKLAEEE